MISPAIGLAPISAYAQARYSNRPIRIVMPFGSAASPMCGAPAGAEADRTHRRKPTMDRLVDTMSDETALAKRFGATARTLYFNGE